MFETIRLETDARGVATLTLAREEKHNAMSAQMIAELHRAAEALGADPVVRVVVLAAQGKTFCAGGDLGWMREQFEAEPDARLDYVFVRRGVGKRPGPAVHSTSRVFDGVLSPIISDHFGVMSDVAMTCWV